MKAKQFLFSTFLFLIALFSIYILLFYFQLGAPLNAEWWVKNSYNYKDVRAQNITSRKIIIIGGSNVLFGINSNLIKQKTGLPVINLATQGGLDIDFFYYKIQQHIKEGDVVVLPLEFEYYPRTGEISDWFSQNMQAWGADYIKQLSLINLLKFIISAEPGRVINGVEKQITSSASNTKIVPEKEVLKQLNFLWKEEGPKWRGYSYKSLNKDGDINVEKTEDYTEEFQYFDNNINVTPHFVEVYGKIEKLVKQYHGELYLTYPVTIKNKRFDLSTKDSMQRVTNLENTLKQHKISIQCNAALFNLNKTYFFNGPYHPDKYGALIRSTNLSDCLNRLMSKKYQKLSYNEAIQQTNSLEQKITHKDDIKTNNNL